MTRPFDTIRESVQALTPMYRHKMPPQKKRCRLFRAYETGKMLLMAGLKGAYPDASDTKRWQFRPAHQHLYPDILLNILTRTLKNIGIYSNHAEPR